MHEGQVMATVQNGEEILLKVKTPLVYGTRSGVFKGRGHWAMPPKIFWRLNVDSKGA